MTIRLALAGAVLIVVGALDLGGLGHVTIAAGAAALVASGITWLVARRGGSS